MKDEKLMVIFLQHINTASVRHVNLLFWSEELKGKREKDDRGGSEVFLGSRVSSVCHF